MDFKEVNKKLKHVPYNLDTILEEIKGNGGGTGTVNSVKHRINQSDWRADGNTFSYNFQHNMFSDITSILMYSTEGEQIEFSYTIVNNNTVKLNVLEAQTVDVIVVGIVAVANMTAKNISILDLDNHYTSGDVEGALKEVGSKLKSGVGNILNYCTLSEDGRIHNQDAQIQKCINENAVVDFQNLTMVINGGLITHPGQKLRNGYIVKGSNEGHLTISSVCTLENMTFVQDNFDIRQALLCINSAGNIKIARCTFTNSSIDINSEQEHVHISITDCNFDCNNSANATTTDSSQAVHYFPQNTAIRAIMTRGRIVNLTISDCRVFAGRCFIAATTTKSLLITNNIIMGNDRVQDSTNGLDVVNLNDVNSVIFENNIVKEYKSSASVFYATNGTRGHICNNVFKDCTVENMIYLDGVNHMNINGNEICKTIQDYRYNRGIYITGGSFQNITSNIISDCNKNAISINRHNQHSLISNNTLAFNNKANLEWTATLCIVECHCFTCVGNYIYIDEDQKIGSKPGFSCTDNDYGMVMANCFNSYVDIGRNQHTTCETASNRWL